MAIAANFRKYAQALALQLVLPFGKPVWKTSRPTTRLGREIRACITKAMKARGLVEYPAQLAIPQWWKDAQARDRSFAKFMKEGQQKIGFVAVFTKAEIARMNPYKQYLMKGKEQRGEIAIA